MGKYTGKAGIVILLLAGCLSLHAQNDRDSVDERREKIIPRPSIYRPDSTIRDTLRYEYTRIKEVAGRSSLTKELYKLIFVNPKSNRVNVMRTENSELRYQPYAGKRIGRISLNILPPYGYSVYDTLYEEMDLGWIKTMANAIHWKTTERTIRKQLTLKTGRELQPFEVVQNEVLLRGLRFVDDATILAEIDPEDPGIVNLVVVCKDNFSWDMEVSSNFLNSARVLLGTHNFLRLGHYAEYQINYKGNQPGELRWGDQARYQIKSLWGSYVDLTAFYQNDYLAKQMWFDLNRDFRTSWTKWAGGVQVSRVYRSDVLVDVNMVNNQIPFNYTGIDVWGGRSFLLKPRYRYNRNFYLTARFLNVIFSDRPAIEADSNQFYYNRRNFFAAFTYRKLKYYKANLIFDFGKTEDIPTGFYSVVTTGFENNDFLNEGYLAYEARYSYFNPYRQRFYSFEAALGGYLNKDGVERGLFKVGVAHFSKLRVLGNWRFRTYGRAHYITGIRRYEADYLLMRGHDIWGFDSDTLVGNQKISASLMSTFFLPYIYKGFRMSVNAALDAGIIAPEKRSLLKSKMYWGISAGVNLRNDNLVFKNITLRLSFYPVVPSDMRHFSASMSGKWQEGFYDYEVRKPRMAVYE